MIQAIETNYHGCRFRSRLEARWAVFFDQLGIKWDYEKEGFDIDGQRYLPDFCLSGLVAPAFPVWIEVKPDILGYTRQVATFQAFARSNMALLVLTGTPEPKRVSDGLFLAGKYGAWSAAWAMCERCGKVGILAEEDHGPTRFFCACMAQPDWPQTRGYNPDNPVLVSALRAARQARFEFGETGAPMSRHAAMH